MIQHHTISLSLPEQAPRLFTYLSCLSSHHQKKESAILFLHGILGDARTWAPYMPAFLEYDVYALTQSGFGVDSDSDVLFDTMEHAKELIAFCKALNLSSENPQRKFIIIAWSYACHVALLAAKMAPELFESMILYELIVPSYGIKVAEQERFTKDITKMMSPIIKAYRRNKEDVAIDAFIAACKNAEYSLAAQADHIQKIKTDNAPSLQKLLTQKEPLAISAEALNAIHQKVPITILYGENSREIFHLSSQAGIAAISQEAGMIRDADHLLPEDDPQKFIEILQTTLTK